MKEMSLIIGKSVSKVTILFHMEFSYKLFKAMVTLQKKSKEEDVAHNFKTNGKSGIFSV